MTKGYGLGGALIIGALMLSGCSQPVPPPPTPEQALALRPADARIAKLYETSCMACHAVAGTGAPLVHDHAAWDPRMKQGMPVLVEHVLQGYRAMPATGQCLTCTPPDHQALIRFMADQPEPTS
jgi:cytochrome c5